MFYKDPFFFILKGNIVGYEQGTKPIIQLAHITKIYMGITIDFYRLLVSNRLKSPLTRTND